MENKRNYKIDNIRALAIIIVVLGHSIILYSSSWRIYTSIYSINILNNIKEIINLFQMPLFFSLSGFLFYYSINKKISLSYFIKEKFSRLIIPYFGIALIWMIPIKLLLKYNNYISKSFYEIIRLLISGYDAGHLWYLLTLFIIFLFIKIYYSLFNRNKYKDSILLVLTLIMLMLSGRLEAYPSFNYFFDYTMYFYIGMMINKYYRCLTINSMQKIIMIMSSLFFIVFSFFINNIIFSLLASIVIVITIYSIITDEKIELLNKISANSFGIYLFHSPLIYITYTYLNNAHPIIVIFINFIVFGLAAYLITSLIRKTKLRFLIGE